MIEEQEGPAERDIVEVNGLMVDVSTGEVLSLVTEKAHFRVKDQNSAEWVLERLTEAEAEVDAIRRRREILNANLDAMEAPARRRVDWLRTRFTAELEEWARQELDGKKVRSVRTPWGQLSFRKTKARLKVDDESRALAWCRENFPLAIKHVESVLVSQLLLEVAAVAPPGFVIEPERDSFRVDCGQ